MIHKDCWFYCLALVCLGSTYAQQTNTPNIPARLTIPSSSCPKASGNAFLVPLPAHAQPTLPALQPSFSVSSSRATTTAHTFWESGSAQYMLQEDKKSLPLTPELANLNLPVDTSLTTKDTGEKIFLPAGTYRQMMVFPIDSPLLREDYRTRELKSPSIETVKSKSRYAPPSEDPVWVRFESLEKIKVGYIERRGGLDIPSHGPTGLGPRVWYAKSETADLASSAFYFVFGGLGYSVANLAGWSAGNTRELPNDFEYRLIRK